MELIRKETAEVVSLAIRGRLDASSAAQAEQVVADFLRGSGKKLILDLTELDYISSAGLRVLLMADKGLQQKSGALALCGLKPNVKEVLDVSGFTALFRIAATAEQALAALGGKSA
ncbi:MAG: STAS domain-containing protein [Elusimicrobia bacterium]|nr:STAS domain-containing protein [Elusimicrobiota bacterium]